MPDSHNVGHCLKVQSHMKQTVEPKNYRLKQQISKNRELSLLLAALLHDADDHKYFGADSKNAENIQQKSVPKIPNRKTIIEEVLEMISYVSTSDNGTQIPPRAKTNPEFLWVRYCDRLEAIGKIGIVRAWQYSLEKDRVQDNEGTPRPKTEKDIWNFATKERFDKYLENGKSVSMMDHYYDKIFHIVETDVNVTRNTWLVDKAKKMISPQVKVCLLYGRTGKVPEDLIKSYAKEYGFNIIN